MLFITDDFWLLMGKIHGLNPIDTPSNGNGIQAGVRIYFLIKPSNSCIIIF